jgi:hypothetical protein
MMSCSKSRDCETEIDWLGRAVSGEVIKHRSVGPSLVEAQIRCVPQLPSEGDECGTDRREVVFWNFPEVTIQPSALARAEPREQGLRKQPIHLRLKPADAKQDKATAAAGIPLIRWKVKAIPDDLAIREAIPKPAPKPDKSPVTALAGVASPDH